MAVKPGQSFLDQVIAQLPESQREQARTIFSSADATAAIDYVGTQLAPLQGLEAQRQALETQRTTLAAREARLTAWHSNLDRWRQDTEATFAAREEQLRARGAGGRVAGDGDGGAPPVDSGAGGGASGVTPEAVAAAIAKAFNEREGSYAGAMAQTTALAIGHFRQFGEELNIDELYQHPKLPELGLGGVYRLVHKDKIDAAQVKAQAEAEARIRQDERQKVLAEQATRQTGELPYPVGGGESPLDALALPADKRRYSDADVARSYHELVRQNAGAGAGA